MSQMSNQDRAALGMPNVEPPCPECGQRPDYKTAAVLSAQIDRDASEAADLAFGRALHLIDSLLRSPGSYYRNQAVEFLKEHQFKRHCT